MFGAFKKALKGATKEVKAEYGKNKDFLEAVCAAVALVAAADGEIEDTEKNEAIQIISGHATLGKLYSQEEIRSTAATMFSRAGSNSGKQQLSRELSDVRGKEGGAQMAEDVYLVAVDIAAADGEQEEAETAVLNKIAKFLNVDPKNFQF